MGAGSGIARVLLLTIIALAFGAIIRDDLHQRGQVSFLLTASNRDAQAYHNLDGASKIYEQQVKAWQEAAWACLSTVKAMDLSQLSDQQREAYRKLLQSPSPEEPPR